MTLHITPEMARAAYELLRTTPPFKRWKLPPAEEVEFRVTTSRKVAAIAFKGPQGHRIDVSARHNGTLATLVMTVAHEMVHFRQTEKAEHGAEYRRLARQVCRHHTWDEKLFWVDPRTKKEA